MSFANQFRAHLDLVQRHESDAMLEDKVYDIRRTWTTRLRR
jgi:hypothetical protein